MSSSISVSSWPRKCNPASMRVSETRSYLWATEPHGFKRENHVRARQARRACGVFACGADVSPMIAMRALRNTMSTMRVMKNSIESEMTLGARAPVATVSAFRGHGDRR
eukprot:5691116-Prymnesium_polylepis.2